jgi:hypothetical protein
VFIHTVNIEHLPLTPDEVSQVLDEIVNVVRFNQRWRAMKVVHGNGGSHRPSTLKNIVRNWADRNKEYVKGIIPGENCSQVNRTFQEMQKACGTFADPDIEIENSGVTLIWVK